MTDNERGSDILAYTVSYGDRPHLSATVSAMRGTAGVWFDWFVVLGNPSASLRETAEKLLHDPDRQGIQHLLSWPENRGQHHATKAALDLAKAKGYKWLLRIDDDMTPRTKRWLKKMIERLEELRKLADDPHYRFIAAPRITSLRNPLQPEGVMEKGQKFPVEVMPVLGGACRLHPMELMEGYEPSLYAPKGRGDPESIAEYLEEQTTCYLIRFPDIRMIHNTDKLEAKDSKAQAHTRRMGHYWPYLGAEV